MSNYPDSTWECDPRAPWNGPGAECGTCRYAGAVGRVVICTAGCCIDGDPDGYGTVDPRGEACEMYERRGA
ncbi:MAG TPA: hypothetical protein IAC12_03730 [Candidatus Aphodovivens avistercoris]|nr:hypothetical protein [Candidatus Aphodovivens avistercoris]